MEWRKGGGCTWPAARPGRDSKSYELTDADHWAKRGLEKGEGRGAARRGKLQTEPGPPTLRLQRA